MVVGVTARQQGTGYRHTSNSLGMSSPQSTEPAWTAAVTTAATAISSSRSSDWTDEASIIQVVTPPILLVVALVLGIAANLWIQKLLSGKQGLGSFLSDGSGFNKSGFRPITTTTSSKDDEERAVSSDPLPWLRLPRLDFVDVAGQDQLLLEDYEKGQPRNSNDADAATAQYNNDAAVMQLERLRERMNDALASGKMEEAMALRKELEKQMKENDIQFVRD